MLKSLFFPIKIMFSICMFSISNNLEIFLKNFKKIKVVFFEITFRKRKTVVFERKKKINYKTEIL